MPSIHLRARDEKLESPEDPTEAGFDFVLEMDGVKISRKRK